MSASRILAALAAVVVSSSAALSATLYSNFNTVEPEYYGDFDTMAGPAYVSGADSYPGVVNHVGNAFTLAAGPGITGYQVTSVQLGMSLIDGPNEVQISIMKDEGNLPDDDHVLASVTLTGQLPDYPESGLVQTDFSANPVSLEPGVKYWLVATPGQSTTAAGWHYNYNPSLVWNPTWESYDVMDNWLTGDTAWFDGSIWRNSTHTDPMGSVPPNDALNAFALEGSAMSVPEPALMGILAGPALCALWIRRRTA